MSLETTAEITGLKQALSELSKLDKSARFKAAAKIKASSPAMLEEGRKQFPADIGISVIHGWGRSKKGKKGRLAYDKTAVDKGVQIMVGGRARGQGITPLVTLVQKSPAGAMFSQAGTKDKTTDFGKLMNNVFGTSQRGIWRSRKFIAEQGSADIMKAVDEVIDEGITGYKVKNENEMCEAVSRIDLIDRKICREQASQRFDIKVIASN